MSNDVVRQQFQFPDRRMDNVSDRMDSLTSDMQNQVVAPISHNYVSFRMPVSSDQGRTVEPTSYSGFPDLMSSNNPVMQPGARPGILGFEDSGIMVPNTGSQSSLLPSKRKAEVEATMNSSISPRSLMANKRTVQMGTSSHLPQSLQPTAVNRKSGHMQMQSKLGPSNAHNVPSLNKKLVRNESNSGKSASQRVQIPKSRTMQVETVSKGRTESAEAVRSKMREKLVEALSVVSESPDKSSNADKNTTEASNIHQSQGDTSPPGSDTGGGAGHEKRQVPDGTLPYIESGPAGKSDSTRGLSVEIPNNGNFGSHVESCKETQHGSFLPQDVSFSDNFFVKDELLQGNGLSWALDFDMGVTGVEEVPSTEKPKCHPDEASQVAGEQERSSPEDLALQIEAELFKLFGGVNKKYKEKGRSLCFNLKDPSNPELRERVRSGEIAPERLCSMTAEELASKELSEWRMAKAEELAQMVVLPDTEFDRRRRLVKKTHKGEYQVEMEEDTGDVMDVSTGTSLNHPKSKETGPNTSSELDGVKNVQKRENQKNGPESHDVPGSLIIPSDGDGSDFMQGMIVDELKDAEFLPPIISLDEFMESLDSEPPFENLQVDASKSSHAVEKEKSDVDNHLAVESEASKDLGNVASEKADEAVAKNKVDVAVRTPKSPEVQKIPPGNSPRIEHLWEGTLQLAISSTITTFCVFKSGERTTTVEWPKSLEIKGRVRLDAFEKFIKELPMSRSRAVMILHFALKDKESETDLVNLQEAVDSYVSDKRLGYAEPAGGVELYFCPPNEKMIDMLSNYLMKPREDIANSSDNGLIGVVVWRKAHISSTISPNSASHNKHTSSTKRQQQHLTSSSRRHQEKDANVNVNLMNKGPVYRPSPNVHSPPDDDDSDIPPGFGPPGGGGVGGARDDDDLPEFNFPGNMNPVIARSTSHNLSRMASFKGQGGSQRPVDQMRELVHKYGQTTSGVSHDSNSRPWLGNNGSGVGFGIEPWNDDDDDDIPEWRPQPPQPPNHVLRQPLHNAYGNQHLASTVAQQQLNPAGISYQSLGSAGPAWQQGGRWVQPPPAGNAGSIPSGGQYYRMPMLQQDGSRSRGY